MKSKNDRYGLAIILIFAALAVCLKIPAALKPELSGFYLGGDDSVMLQSMWRAEHGLGYAYTSADETMKDSDLSAVKSVYPRLQSPGVRWMMSVTGLGRYDAYKFFYLLCAFTGTVGWLLFGKKLLGRGALAVFGVALAFHYGTGWGKLADVFVWALVPYYLFFLAAACEEDGKALSPAVMAAGVIGALLTFFWFGCAYLGAAGALAVLVLGRGGVSHRFLRSGLMAGLSAVVVLFVYKGLIQSETTQAWVEHAWGGTGFHLFIIPISHYFESASVLFGDVPFAAIISIRFSSIQLPIAKILIYLFLASVSILLTLLAVAAFKRNLLSAGQKKFFAIFSIHFCVLFLILFCLSVRYLDPSIQGNVNFLEQARRYMWHVATAGGLFWICAAWAWLGAALKGSFGKTRRVIAAAVLIFAVGIIAGNLYFVISGRAGGSIGAVRALALDAMNKPYSFIANDIRTNSRGAVKVFDAEDRPYLIDGSINVFRRYYSADWLSKSENTKPIFIYVVMRHEMRKSKYRKDPDSVIEKDSKFMTIALNLDKMADLDNGTIEVYGGEVGPYAKGSLATAPVRFQRAPVVMKRKAADR